MVNNLKGFTIPDKGEILNRTALIENIRKKRRK